MKPVTLIKATIMKKLILILFFCSSSSLNAQWIDQQSGTTAAFHNVKFYNQLTGWACGNGVIARTTNGGTNWVLQTHPATNKFLYGLSIIDANTAFCVGWFETILKTTDGGSNWIAIRNGQVAQGASYFATHFINQNTGWIAGDFQKVLKTTNGGNTFDSIYLFVGDIRDLYFKDSLDGVLSGIGGLLKKTTNGGLNWYTPNINLYGNGYNFYKLSFVNNQTGWIVGNIKPVYRTTDFGANWDSIGSVEGADEIYCSFFSSVNTGWAAGTFGRMFKTTNSGFTWRQENTGTFTSFFSSIWFYNDSIGYAVRGGGRIMKTTTSGLTFINNSSSEIVPNYKLHQNYPNPFNPLTRINYELRITNYVSINIYNSLGVKITSFINKKQSSGSYSINFNSNEFNLASGIYYYSLLVDGEIKETRKMILLK